MNAKTEELPDNVRFEQLQLVYDYIKFHIGLYIGTPAVLAIVAKGLGVDDQVLFRIGMLTMIALYLAAGAHAGRFMGKHINQKWSDGYLGRFEHDAFKRSRRVVHHTFYWVGLGAGAVGLAASVLWKMFVAP